MDIGKSMEPLTVRAAWRGRPLDVLVRPGKPSDEGVVAEVLTRRVYDRRGVSIARSKHWLDAGAHIGTFALAAACEGCRVDSFEPHPENCSLLRLNLERNGLQQQVCVHNAALQSLPAAPTTPLFLAPRSTATHSTTTAFRSGQQVEVGVVGVEAFLRAHPTIDGLKLDVEGAEMAILESLLRPQHRELLAPVNQLVFEWDFTRDKRTSRLRWVLDGLRNLGFEVAAHPHVWTREQWLSWPSGSVVYAFRI